MVDLWRRVDVDVLLYWRIDAVFKKADETSRDVT